MDIYSMIFTQSYLVGTFKYYILPIMTYVPSMHFFYMTVFLSYKCNGHCPAVLGEWDKTLTPKCCCLRCLTRSVLLGNIEGMKIDISDNYLRFRNCQCEMKPF